MQRLGDQRLVEAGTVGVGRVDQVDPEIEGAMEQPLGPDRIGVGPPIAGLARQPHGTIGHAGHLQLAAELERSGGSRRPPVINHV